MKENLLLSTDAYKMTHHLQYPKGLTKLYSYAEARTGAKFPTVSYFGLQMIIQDHLMIQITDEMIDEAQKTSQLTFGTDAYFNRDAWEKVRDLGYFPVKIKSLPEGLEVPISNALFTIESTEDWFATSLNSLEAVLMHVWYPTTIATNSLYIKKELKKVVDVTGSDDSIELMVNDFGLRGATSLQSAQRGGAGHLVHFRGSDNIAATKIIADDYDYAGRVLSVWATEHSVATSYGPSEGEIQYINEQFDRAPENMILSIVIDSYDTLNFIDNVVGNEQVANRIKQREGRVVFRPDSGNPKEIIPTILNKLEAIFGSTKNSKGYKVLNDNVGVIQGDGMNATTIIELYKLIVDQGWSSDNLVVGSGGGLLQEGFSRDTERFAIKASYGELGDGNGFNIQKHPKTDPTKNSKSGRLKVIRKDGEIQTVSFDEPGDDLLQTVYENGVLKPISFDEILENAKI